jgi:23S rRNA pseudouridine2605 synthase
VQVNGETVTRLGTTADPQRDRIFVDGKPLVFSAAPLYFLLHKPAGVVCTLKDPQGRPTVRDLLRNVRERVFPVGRLDYDSAGLLLLTNDGDLTERLLHPRYQLPRTYHVKIAGSPSPEALNRLRAGVQLDDGTLTGATQVGVLRRNERKTWLEITLQEGKNREVRRMCEAVGHRAEKLIRVRFGPLILTDLAIGAYRQLTTDEVQALQRAAGRSPRDKTPGDKLRKRQDNDVRTIPVKMSLPRRR